MKATQSSQNKHPVEPKFRVPESHCPSGVEGSVFSPPVDIYESADRFVVLADIPGATSENTDLSVEEDEMILTARVEEAADEERAAGEYPVGHWFRRFELSGVDVEEVEAALENGVLTVRLPKKGSAERRTIEIN